MFLWKILVASSLIAWFLPVPVFRNSKYFHYFLINSLVDPVYIALHHNFQLGTYNYIPFALLAETAFFPLLDIKSRSISIVALLTISITLGVNIQLEFIICELVLFLMMFNLLKHVVAEMKSESSLKIFQVLLLIYFFRNALMLDLYYLDQNTLVSYYTLFLCLIIIIPVLIAFYGPNKKVILNNKISEYLSKFGLKQNLNIPVMEVPSSSYKKITEENPTPPSQIFLSPNEIELSQREQEILLLIRQGMTSREIANKLFLSKRTVDCHRAAIRQKVGHNYYHETPPPRGAKLKNRRKF